MKFWILRFSEYTRTSLLPISIALAGAIPLVMLCLMYLETGGYLSAYLAGAPEIDERLVINIAGLLLGAMVTITAIIFPVTFSMLQRAMSQYSPVVLQTYRNLTSVKLLIGMIIGSTLSIVLLLTALALDIYSGVPISALIFVLITIVAVICSLPICFNLFIKALEPTYLAKVVADQLKPTLMKYEQITDRDSGDSNNGSQDRTQLSRPEGGTSLAAKEDGYLESIHINGLVEELESMNLVGRVPVRPGDFIYEGQPLIHLDANCSLDHRDSLLQYFILGEHRQGLSDLELQIDQLVHICLKALSPSTNDLATATECIGHIGLLCNIMLDRQFHHGVHKDDDGTERLYTKEFDFSGFIDAGFERIRQNGKGQPSVVISMLDALAKLAHRCESKPRRQIIINTAEAVCADAASIATEPDKQAIQQALSRVKSHD